MKMIAVWEWQRWNGWQVIATTDTWTEANEIMGKRANVIWEEAVDKWESSAVIEEAKRSDQSPTGAATIRNRETGETWAAWTSRCTFLPQIEE